MSSDYSDVSRSSSDNVESEEEDALFSHTIRHGILLQNQYDQLLAEGEIYLNRLYKFQEIKQQVKNWAKNKTVFSQDDSKYFDEFSSIDQLPQLDTNFVIPIRPYLKEAQNIVPSI